MDRASGKRSQAARFGIIAIAVLAGLLIAPSPASAHPNLLGSSPSTGAQLGSGPSSIVIRFDEAVKMAVQGTRIVDQNGTVVPSSSKLSNKNKTLTITPKSRLGKGMYAAAYNLWSVEGHFVPGAVSFTVATPTAKGTPITAKPIPNIPTKLDGNKVGKRTITFQTSKRKGDVNWRGPGVGEPITWKFTGNGSTATATGVLPTKGPWTFEIDLSTKDSVLIPKGTVTLS